MVYFTERYFPLFVVLSWGPWEKGLDSQRYLEAFRQVASRKLPFVALSEARWSVLPDAPARKEIAEMADRVSGMTKDLNIGNVAVLASRLAWGAATAVAWLTRRRAEITYVTSAMDGLERLQRMASVGGLTLPSEATGLCRRLDRLAALGQLPNIDRVQALL